ncbi:MAG: hypothetical protein ABI651_03590 [Verrucomicrobiota bacterium]
MRSILVATMAFVLGGCAHKPMPQSGAAHHYLSVSFPRLKLTESEYIQSVEVIVRCGRIVSIGRLLNDWDLEVQWDNPSFLKLRTQARHFSAGLPNVNQLADFITVEETADPDCFSFVGKKGMTVTATLFTDMTDPPGGGVRKYSFPRPN